MRMPTRSNRVFISHSGKDKQFVRKLVSHLRSYNIEISFVEKELKIGDSIVEGISEELNEAGYLIIILSKNSANSPWVQAELNTAIMDQLSGKGIVVLPVLIEDCNIPTLLRDRVYADFRRDFAIGLEALMEVFRQESNTNPVQTLESGGGDCFTKLSSLSDADLRRLINSRVQRSQVSMLWFDTLGDDMEDHLPNQNKLQCIIQLLMRVKHQGLRDKLITNICKDLEYTANP
jgi:hypothetical protein